MTDGKSLATYFIDLPVPALVCVDQIIRGANTVKQKLTQEAGLGYPLPPLIIMYEDFDATEYEKIIYAEVRYAKDLDTVVEARRIYRGEQKSKVTRSRHELLEMLYTNHNVKISEIVTKLRAHEELQCRVDRIERHVARLRRENGILKSPK